MGTPTHRLLTTVPLVSDAATRRLPAATVCTFCQRETQDAAPFFSVVSRNFTDTEPLTRASAMVCSACAFALKTKALRSRLGSPVARIFTWRGHAGATTAPYLVTADLAYLRREAQFLFITPPGAAAKRSPTAIGGALLDLLTNPPAPPFAIQISIAGPHDWTKQLTHRTPVALDRRGYDILLLRELDGAKQVIEAPIVPSELDRDVRDLASVLGTLHRIARRAGVPYYASRRHLVVDPFGLDGALGRVRVDQERRERLYETITLPTGALAWYLATRIANLVTSSPAAHGGQKKGA